MSLTVAPEATIRIEDHGTCEREPPERLRRDRKPAEARQRSLHQLALYRPRPSTLPANRCGFPVKEWRRPGEGRRRGEERVLGVPTFAGLRSTPSRPRRRISPAPRASEQRSTAPCRRGRVPAHVMGESGPIPQVTVATEHLEAATLTRSCRSVRPVEEPVRCGTSPIPFALSAAANAATASTRTRLPVMNTRSLATVSIHLLAARSRDAAELQVLRAART